MLAELVAAALVAATPTPSASPPEALATPLREVVYAVSTSLLIDDITESYGGGEDASAPSSTSIESRSGVVTIDVMTKLDTGVLDIQVLEHWKMPPLPQRFTGVVAPDGTGEFPPATIAPGTIELLPFFATRLIPTGSLAAGTHWTVRRTDDKSLVVTDYSITASNATTVTIRKITAISALGNEAIDGAIVYDSSSSAPISGKVRMKRTDTFADGQTQLTLDMTFTRLSDTSHTASTP